jgi:catechol O-methyltransferase
MDLFGSDDEEEERDSTLVRPKTCGVLAFHPGTEQALILHVKRTSRGGDVGEILRAVDVFCSTRHWMMHVGPVKAKIIKQEISSRLESDCRTSLVCVELGSYCGYSACTLASHLLAAFPERPLRYICIEGDPECVGWSRELVEYCSLSHIITVVEGTVSSTLTTNVVTDLVGEDGKIDLLFIDHDKAAYRSDLELIEKANLLRSGSVVAADNVLSFGKPIVDYLTYVRDPERFSSSELFLSSVEYSEEGEEEDGVEISIKA